MNRVICAVCGDTPQVASIQKRLYIHYCELTQTTWYTNGLIWSNTIVGMKGEERA